MLLDAADVRTRDPLNAETAWSALAPPITPVAGFFVRTHGDVPRIDGSAWRLAFEGFSHARPLALADLASRATVEVEVVLECAGNARTRFEPSPEGTPWGDRAVGCARFRGTPLRGVLEEAGLPPGTEEVVFHGSDRGERPFARSLPLDVARAPDTLLAWEMNGAPLAPEHGFPVRLVVPAWYAVASVKWLARIEASPAPFRGHYQVERYVYEAADGRTEPVREKRVKSLVVEPAPGARVAAGTPVRVAGRAWSGAAAIERVEVSADGGATWVDADLGPPAPASSWRSWSAVVRPQAGPNDVLARATDASGARQPEAAAWNVHGYGHDAPARTRVVGV